jgi:hypothetical protein
MRGGSIEGPTAFSPTGEGMGDMGRGLIGDSKRPPDPAIPDPTIRETSNTETMASGKNNMRPFNCLFRSLTIAFPFPPRYLSL